MFGCEKNRILSSDTKYKGKPKESESNQDFFPPSTCRVESQDYPPRKRVNNEVLFWTQGPYGFRPLKRLMTFSIHRTQGIRIKIILAGKKVFLYTISAIITSPKKTKNRGKSLFEKKDQELSQWSSKDDNRNRIKILKNEKDWNGGILTERWYIELEINYRVIPFFFSQNKTTVFKSR